MRTLVLGGASSGKSEYAESAAVGLALPRYYIATMMPFDSEDVARIDRHRAMRADKGFITMERYTNLAGLVLPKRGTALLECLGNLSANEVFSDDGAGEDALGAVLRGIDALSAQCTDLVVVSNDVFCDGADYDAETRRYIDILANVNHALAARFDNVVELVCGIPIMIKGGAA